MVEGAASDKAMSGKAMSDKAYERDQVVKIINSVIDKVQMSDGMSEVYDELKALKDIVDEARREISLSKPSDITGKHIPSATDELDAIVAATEEATITIMDACEAIQLQAEKMDDDASSATFGQVTKILEACSFQDLTGQRITKVVNTLVTIDEKVRKLLVVVSEKVPGVEKEERAGGNEDDFVNGPQLKDKAISQADIDKLLAEFD